MVIPASSRTEIRIRQLIVTVSICCWYIRQTVIVPVTCAVYSRSLSLPAAIMALAPWNARAGNISARLPALRLASFKRSMAAPRPSTSMRVPLRTFCSFSLGLSSSIRNMRRPVPAIEASTPALCRAMRAPTVSSRLMLARLAIGAAYFIESTRRSMFNMELEIPAAKTLTTLVVSVTGRLNCRSVAIVISAAVVMSESVAPASSRTPSVDSSISLVFMPPEARAYIAPAA